MATVDARGYVYIMAAHTHGKKTVRRVPDLHIGVGFCVARSDSNGQCKAFEVWDE